MATKIYCDKCKKELLYWPTNDGHTVVTSSKGDTSSFDLCSSCWIKVIGFIRRGDK